MTADPSDAPERAVAQIRAALPDFAPRLGIILGSGLGGFANAIAAQARIAYADLPGFPLPGVGGHAGRLTLGDVEGCSLVCFEGRAHFYEGHGLAAMATPIRMLKKLGADILLVTNAAGSLRPEVGPGALIAITDHFSLLPGSPLIGPNDPSIGPRFPAMGNAYDRDLLAQLEEAAARLGLALGKGVYAGVAGPQFETAAEIRMLRLLGGDLVGMSSVPEVILARHCGLRVLALSLVTNLAEGLSDEVLSHERTLAAAASGAGALIKLIQEFIRGNPH